MQRQLLGTCSRYNSYHILFYFTSYVFVYKRETECTCLTPEYMRDNKDNLLLEYYRTATVIELVTQ